MFGQRKQIYWTSKLDSTRPLFGTRGPKHGNLGPASAVTVVADYKNSPTLLLHASKKEWEGNIVYADNHTEFTTTMFPVQTGWDCAGSTGSLDKDNIFCMDFICGGSATTSGAAAQGDAILAFTIGGPTATNGALVYDKEIVP